MRDPMRAEQDPAGKCRFLTPLGHRTRGSCTSSTTSIPVTITGNGGRGLPHSAGTEPLLLCPRLGKAGQRWLCHREE